MKRHLLGDILPERPAPDNNCSASLDLDQEQLDPRLTRELPREIALQHRMVPLRVEGDRLIVALAAPVTLSALEIARRCSGKAEVLGVIATSGALGRAIDRLYGYPLSLATTQPVSAGEIERALDERASQDRPVILYGWSQLLAQHLTQSLAREGIRSRIVDARAMTAVTGADVVLAPIPAVEALTRKGQVVRYRLIAAGRTPDFDLPRAHALGAKSFVLAPIDTQLLLRAVHRCRAEHPPAGLEAHGAA